MGVYFYNVLSSNFIVLLRLALILSDYVLHFCFSYLSRNLNPLSFWYYALAINAFYFFLVIRRYNFKVLSSYLCTLAILVF